MNKQTFLNSKPTKRKQFCILLYEILLPLVERGWVVYDTRSKRTFYQQKWLTNLSNNKQEPTIITWTNEFTVWLCIAFW